jgi:hypothetical protein
MQGCGQMHPLTASRAHRLKQKSMSAGYRLEALEKDI